MVLTLKEINAHIEKAAVTRVTMFPEEMRIGDTGYDEEVKKALQQMKSRYGHWGWCMVEVTRTYHLLSSSQHLAECSYKSEKDFVKNSGYFEDMKKDNLREITDQIGELLTQIGIK